MENSHSFITNSSKKFDENQNKNNLQKKIRKSFKNLSRITPNNLNTKNNSALNIFSDKTPFTCMAKNCINIKNIYNKITPSCLRKNKKYGNFYIFGKRELYLNQSIKEGKKVFKYQELVGNLKKPKNMRKITKSNSSSNSIYLTEYLSKTIQDQISLPLLEKEKLVIEEDKSNSINKINQNQKFNRNSYIKKNKSFVRSYTNDNDINNISNILKNANKNKKDMDIILLKKIKLNTKNDDNDLINNEDEYLKNKSLLKKQKILEQSILGNQSVNEYINDFRKIILDKYNLKIKNEKVKVVNENIDNKLNKIKDDLKDLETNSELFIKNFYPKFNEYIKFFMKQQEIERQKNMYYINKVYLLEKNIAMIKNKINKCQNEKEYLMREMFLQICIHEKKLDLPKYYKDILLNDFSYEKVKEKYGQEITEDEYNRVSGYINSLDISDMEMVLDKLNQLTNNNIELINSYNKARENHLRYKKYQKKVEEEVNNDVQKEIDNLIIEKEKQLNILMKKYKLTEKDLSNVLKYVSKSNNIRTKHGKLYTKIEYILDNLNNNLHYEFDFDDRIKGTITEEKIIIQMLRKIEIIITMFLAQYKNDKIIYPEKVKYFKNIFDKDKKIQKAKEQKIFLFQKLEKEREKIFERYNKILFLQNRKIYIKKLTKTKSFDKDLSKHEEKKDKIDDFLYD